MCSATVAVADVAALDAESFYEDHVSSSLPLLIRDEQLHALRGRWTDEYLSELAGAQMHAEVRLSAGNASNSFPLVKVAGERTEPQRGTGMANASPECPRVRMMTLMHCE